MNGKLVLFEILYHSMVKGVRLDSRQFPSDIWAEFAAYCETKGSVLVG